MDKFEDYLLKEYEQIASAHFNTINTISVFFRYYIILMAVPISLGPIFISSLLKYQDQTDFLFSEKIFGIGFLGLSILGFFICSHLISLRHDALLYARTVNGIRKYFYNNSKLSELEKLNIRVLPRSIFKPDYHDVYFKPVVWVFSIIDCFYFVLGLLSLKFININHFIKIYNFNLIYFQIPLIALLFVAIHFLTYKSHSVKREKHYLISNRIGIDIDGVLNKHRDHFCEFINNDQDLNIKPDDISHIPVHEAGLGVSKSDEVKVFNNPKYWTEMPVEDDASSNVEKLSKSLGKIVCIYTERTWPILNGSKNENNETIRLWKKATEKLIYGMNMGLFEKIKENITLSVNCIIFKHKIINQITRLWLKKNNFMYDQLTIENNYSKPLYFKKEQDCRFSSAKTDIKYFIEDDPEKAIRLSFLCDFVFLFEHPYNTNWDFPRNVMRAKDWTEIFKQLRMFTI